MTQRPERQRPSVDFQRQTSRNRADDARGVRARCAPRACLFRLKGRDLGEIEDVQDVDPIARRNDAAVVVGGEVAQRVCGRRRWRQHCREDHGEQGHALHLRSLLATGAQSSEKCGLSSSARLNQLRAAAFRSRQRSIMPRWKNLDASRVPSRSARFE